MNRRRSFPAGVISVVLLALTTTAPSAERFGDVVVAGQSIANGDTFHGYREHRILLENQSTKRAHEVTIVLPDRSFGFGNSLSRISRTVKLDPLARMSVPLWQPPLPVNGNGLLQVHVDGELLGTITLPGSAQHAARSGSHYGGGASPGTILVSRSLDFEAVGRVLKADPSRKYFSASAATGEPDALTTSGLISGAWMPEPSSPGPHWLELDYDAPIEADRVRIQDGMGFVGGGDVVLIGVSGTNVARVSVRPPTPTVGGTSTGIREATFPLTSERIKTVRLEFAPSTYAGSIAIDAVAVAGPAGRFWASTARASSESSVSASMAPGMAAGELNELLRSETPVAEWSEYWLSYTPYDAIVLNAADLKTAPSAVLDAVWRYVECGGNLFVFGAAEVPAPWRSLAKTRFTGGQSFKMGFGSCFVVEADRPEDLRKPTVKAMAEAILTSARYWQSLPDENTANASFPVIDNVRIPIRGMVFIMLGFVILIGPVNLIVLSKLKRRTWLLWTVPAISFATCLLVFVYSLFSEGITPDARVESLTVLDQVNRRAASVGTEAFYCPLTPSQGLFFEAGTEATPLVELWGSRSGSARQMDWSQSQHLERGWITARVPAHFRVRKSETRRERIQLDTSAGQKTVMNGLGAPISSLWVADASGQIYRAEAVAEGNTAVLSKVTGRAKVTGHTGLPSFLERPGTHPLDSIDANNAPDYLLPNTYIAELDRNPFVEHGLGPKAKSSRTRSRCVVYGIFETP